MKDWRAIELASLAGARRIVAWIGDTRTTRLTKFALLLLPFGLISIQVPTNASDSVTESVETLESAISPSWAVPESNIPTRDPLSSMIQWIESPARGSLEEIEIETRLVPSPAIASILLPPGDKEVATQLPLIVLLHGGEGDHHFLQEMKGLIEQAWALGVLAPAVFVTPSAGRSFYLDYRDGSQRWETFVLTELLPYVRSRFHTGQDSRNTLIAGISMGGMGALRMAFKHPDQFCAVAALEPAIAPVRQFDDIALEDRFWRNMTLLEALYGKPIDRGYWKANNPVNIVEQNARMIRDSGLRIYLEVGDADSFNLFRGTEFLHRELLDLSISHAYRVISGADHLGLTLPTRFLYAFAQLNQALAPPPEDKTLRPFHELIHDLRTSAGLKN